MSEPVDGRQGSVMLRRGATAGIPDSRAAELHRYGAPVVHQRRIGRANRPFRRLGRCHHLGEPEPPPRAAQEKLQTFERSS